MASISTSRSIRRRIFARSRSSVERPPSFSNLLRLPLHFFRAVLANQSCRGEVFRPGQQVVLFGPLEYRGAGLQFSNPEYELLRSDRDAASDAEDEPTIHTGRIVPIYEKAGSVTPRMQRTL